MTIVDTYASCGHIIDITADDEIADLYILVDHTTGARHNYLIRYDPERKANGFQPWIICHDRPADQSGTITDVWGGIRGSLHAAVDIVLDMEDEDA